ncbi:MAG: hypothetical protein PXY39_13850 [archaeon]|nr:hypothetical protein [archaeon]
MNSGNRGPQVSTVGFVFGIFSILIVVIVLFAIWLLSYPIGVASEYEIVIVSVIAIAAIFSIAASAVALAYRY